MSDQPNKQELPPLDEECAAKLLELQHPIFDKPERLRGFGIVDSKLACRERQLLAALSDNEALRANPKVADCSICGASIFSSNERITEDGRTYHPICAVRADNEAKAARIAELERTKHEWALQINALSDKEVQLLAKIEKLEDRITISCGRQESFKCRAQSAEAKLKSVEGLLKEPRANYKSTLVNLLAKLRAIVEGK